MAILKKVFSVLLRIAISVALLAYLFRQVDERAMARLIRDADKGMILVALAIYSLTYLLCFYRWYMLLNASKVKLPAGKVCISYSGGIFFNLFLPSTIGGDVVRTLDLGRYSKKPGQVVASVFLDRLSGYVGLVILALISLAAGWRLIQDRNIIIWITAVTGILVLVLLILFNEFLYLKVNRVLNASVLGRVGQAFKAMHDRLHDFRAHKKVMFKNVVLSFIIQIISPLTSYMIALALGIKINPAFFFIFMPVIGAITLLPISIGGLGLRDTMTVLFFAKAGVGKDLAFAMSLLNFSFLILYGLIAGLIYFFAGHLLKENA
jgi:glycosyltransferase 2 family protein